MHEARQRIPGQIGEANSNSPSFMVAKMFSGTRSGAAGVTWSSSVIASAEFKKNK